MEENNEFDEQIKKTLHLIAGRRKEKKITQTEMGRVLGLTLNSYRKIELGTSQMKMKTLLKLSKSLDLNFFKEDFLTESIISDKSDMGKIIINNEIKHSKEVKELEKKIEILKGIMEVERKERKGKKDEEYVSKKKYEQVNQMLTFLIESEKNKEDEKAKRFPRENIGLVRDIIKIIWKELEIKNVKNYDSFTKDFFIKIRTIISIHFQPNREDDFWEKIKDVFAEDYFEFD